MSRRKQANPKSLKRKANEEIDELVELLHLPSDVLTIKESNNASAAYTIFTKIPLSKGTLFGPFRGQISRGRNSTLKTTIIEARDVGGEKIFLNLNDETGSWLRLVKLATSPNEANLIVFVEGNEIWCSIYCDTAREEELSVWYRITSHKRSPNAGLSYSVAPSIAGRECYTSVSRYKIPCPDEDKSRVFVEECEDLSMSTFNSRKQSLVSVNGDVSSEQTPDRLSPEVNEPLTDDTPHIDSKISIKSEKSPDSSNSSSDDHSLDGPLKHGLTSGTHNTDSTISKLARSLPTSLSTRSSPVCFPLSSSHLSVTSGPTESSVSSGVSNRTSGYLCAPCGITFSSQSTLEAHCKFYCSYRQDKRPLESESGIAGNSRKEVVLSSKEERIESQLNVNRADHLRGVYDRFLEDSDRQLGGDESDHQSTSSNSAAEEKLTKMENLNTVRKTKTDLQLVSSFLLKVGEQRPLEKIPIKELDVVLSSFIMNVKKRNGEDYEPDSLRGLLSSVDRYLRKQLYPVAIFSPTTENFSKTRESLRMKQLQLKSQGKGSLSTKHVPLTDSEIEKLFLSGQLGAQTKDSIINTLWFYNSVFFGIRSAKRHYELRWGDIVLCELPNSMEYLEYIDQETKKPKEGVMGNFRIYANLDCPDRDPIHIYRLYASHRPDCMKKSDSPFYLVPNHSKATYNSSWFKRQPLGENRLASLMKCMAKKAGLSVEKHFYNISVRRALMLKLQSGI